MNLPFLYFLDFELIENVKDIFNLDYLLNFKVKAF